MKDPWCSNPSQLPHARSAGQPAENRERGATAQFAPRWFLPLAVLGALVALTVFFLALSPASAGVTTNANPVTLPDNLSFTVSKGTKTTDTGPSTMFTVNGDCPPNGGVLMLQMKRPTEEWPAEGLTSYHVAPLGMSMYAGGCPTPDLPHLHKKFDVDGIAPGEEWDVRVYAWRIDDDKTSDDSRVYRVVGWTVPDAPTGLSITSGAGQLSARWNEVAATGTSMPVTTHIRWRTAPVGSSGAAGPWNAEKGVATDTPISHSITGLANGTFYDVEVRAASPMGGGQWARARYATLLLPANAVSTPTTDTTPADSGTDDNSVTLPDNLSVTVSKGSLNTDTGLSTKFTIGGDCPPNGGGFRFQMVRAGTPWPAEGTDLSMSYWPTDAPSSDNHFEVLELRECGSPDWRVTSEIAVDVISPGEKWEVRVYVWRGGSASDFSQVYYVIGWSVPSAPAGLSLTPGQEQLDVEWDGITAVGTDMPVTTHIRWRAAQVGQSGETDYAAAGPWNNDEGVATGGPTSHTITGLAAGTAYDVEVKAASPMGSSEWSAVSGETLPPPGDGPDTADSTQESEPIPVVTFGHQQNGEGEYWVSVNEGDELTVTLRFTPALSKDTSIRWYTTLHHGEHSNGAEHYGTEESNWLRLRSDFVYSDSAAARDIALTAGMTSATFNIKTVQDSEIEGDETFHVHLCGPPPRCAWPNAPPEPHPGRSRILASLEASKDDYQGVQNGPELLVTIVDDDESDDDEPES